jgi:transposase-like protein
MPKRYPEELKQKARELRAGGMTYQAVAEQLGVTGQSVQYWCKPEARAWNTARCSRTCKVRGKYRPAYVELNDREKQAMINLYLRAEQLSASLGTAYEVDHIIPAHKGGIHHPSNMRIVPRKQNRTGRPHKKKAP